MPHLNRFSFFFEDVLFCNFVFKNPIPGIDDYAIFYLDIDRPSSSASSPSSVSIGGFTVSWPGTDTGGSGSALRYDVQYSDVTLGTGWGNWRNNTALSSGYFIGQPGHIYEFRSRARDAAGNQEFWPLFADTRTEVTMLGTFVSCSVWVMKYGERWVLAGDRGSAKRGKSTSAMSSTRPVSRAADSPIAFENQRPDLRGFTFLEVWKTAAKNSTVLTPAPTEASVNATSTAPISVQSRHIRKL